MTRFLPAFALVLALVLAACSSSDTTTTSTVSAAVPSVAEASGDGEENFPVSVTSDAGTVSIASRPARVAALSASHVEMLFAMGAGDQVIAGDLFSNYPAAAAGLEKLDSFNLNIESVIALEPDLVVLGFDPGEAVAALRQVGIPTLLFLTPATLRDAFDQILTLGEATGNRQAAAELVTEVETTIDDIVRATGDRAIGLRYYHEIDPFSFFTPNSSSFIGQLYALLGMENIADGAPDDFGDGFPQLSPEYILNANPDLIFLASPGETVETLTGRAGWDTLSALKTPQSVFLLDPDAAGRWGPRIVDMMAAIASAVSAYAEQGGSGGAGS